MKELVRHIAPSGGRLVAVGAFSRAVEIWDVSSSTRLSAFDSALDFGGARLAMSPDGSLCIVGAYNRFGISAYRSADGARVWERPDIRRVQNVTMSSDGSCVYVGVASGPLLVLDTPTGQTSRKMSGVKRVFEGPFAHLLDRRVPTVETSSKRLFSVIRTTFAILDVAFGPESMCVSESGGPTRCFDLASGREDWRYDPPPDHHLVSLSYCPSARSFVGVSFEYQQTAVKTLVLFRDGGELERLSQLGSIAEAEFCLSGEALVLSDGRVLDSSTGESLRTVPFSQIAA